nr:hypothetical protein [Tanacetum cinerariifolium]
HDDTIDRLYDQLKDMSLDRIEVIEHDVEDQRDRVDAAKQRSYILQLTLEDAWAEIIELQTYSEDSEAWESVVRLRLHMIVSFIVFRYWIGVLEAFTSIF